MQHGSSLRIRILKFLAKLPFDDWRNSQIISDEIGCSEDEVRKTLIEMKDEELVELTGEPDGRVVGQIAPKGKRYIEGDVHEAEEGSVDTTVQEELKNPKSYREQWLNKNFFRWDPFAFTDPDKDPHLYIYSLEMSYFTEISGDPYHPETSLVFGPPGVGKSTIRKRLAIKEDERYRALAVEVTDFSTLLVKAERGKVSEKDVITLLLSSAIKKLAEGASSGRLVEGLSDVKALEALPVDCQSLWTYCHTYHRGPLGEIYQLHKYLKDAQADKKPAPTTEHLQEFCSLVCTIFCRPVVYFLIDPSMIIFEGKKDKFWECLKPLLENVDLHSFGIQGPKMVIKYFLDSEFRKKAVEEVAWVKSKETSNVRSLRLWTQDELIALLNKRITICSKVDKVNINGLADPFESKLDLEKSLTAAAQGSPRSLVETCARLFKIHTDRLPDAPFAPINSEELEKALANPKQEEQENEIRKLISSGKHQTQELKTSLIYDFSTQRQNEELAIEVVEAVCGMANADGGVVWIGVHENGSVNGIEADFSILPPYYRDINGFSHELRGIIRRYITDEEFLAKISDDYHCIDNHWICRVTVQRSSVDPVFVYGKNLDLFPVRFGSITKRLSHQEQYLYVLKHFDRVLSQISNASVLYIEEE